MSPTPPPSCSAVCAASLAASSSRLDTSGVSGISFPNPLTAPLQVVPQLPQQRVVAQRHSLTQVRCPGRAAGTRFRPDLPFHHLHVPCPPEPGQLVVGEQIVPELPEVVVGGPVPRHRAQRREDLLRTAGGQPARGKQGQQFRQPQVAAVGEPPALLAEAAPGAPCPGARRPPPVAHFANHASTSGLARASASAASATGVPSRILRTGTSSFFPDRVRGMPGTWWISSGTCRGDSAARSAVLIRPASSSSRSWPSARTR